MEDDIFAALTQEVKEEVVQNYLYERGLIEKQIDNAMELAKHATKLEEKLSRRFYRIYKVLQKSQFIEQFVQLMGMKEVPFEQHFARCPNPHEGLRVIKTQGITQAGKFRRLLFECYSRLFSWNQTYGKAYDNLNEEIAAVGANLKKFENNFDLLTILRFLREMDVVALERKHYLGYNYTAEEMNAVDMTLRFKPVRIEQFGLTPPVTLPEPKSVQQNLNDLADRIYSECRPEIKSMMNDFSCC